MRNLVQPSRFIENEETFITRKAVGPNRRGRRDRAVLVHQRGGNDRRHDRRRDDFGHGGQRDDRHARGGRPQAWSPSRPPPPWASSRSRVGVGRPMCEDRAGVDLLVRARLQVRLTRRPRALPLPVRIPTGSPHLYFLLYFLPRAIGAVGVSLRLAPVALSMNPR